MQGLSFTAAYAPLQDPDNQGDGYFDPRCRYQQGEASGATFTGTL